MVIDPARARNWHRRLAGDLRGRGHSVSILIKPSRASPPAAISLLLALEHLVYRRTGDEPGSLWKRADLAASALGSADGAPDLVVDCTGDPDAGGGVRTLRPVYASALVEEAAVSELLSGKIPSIGVVDGRAPTQAQMFRAAVERPRVLSKSLDNLGARLATILSGAVERVARNEIVVGMAGVAPLDATQWPRFGALDLTVGRARAALASLAARQQHWFVGWRRADENRLSETMHLPQGGWRRLPDDGARFYADPFVFQHKGRMWLFVEEFPYATNKAIVSVVEMGPDGPRGTPHAVLERPGHLSYPFVFEHGGAVWMIP
jgi:hypothetical protein